MTKNAVPPSISTAQSTKMRCGGPSDVGWSGVSNSGRMTQYSIDATENRERNGVRRAEESAAFVVRRELLIGVGSLMAGWISGHRIEPRLAPIGAVGMSVFFLLLGLVPATYALVGR